MDVPLMKTWCFFARFGWRFPVNGWPWPLKDLLMKWNVTWSRLSGPSKYMTWCPIHLNVYNISAYKFLYSTVVHPQDCSKRLTVYSPVDVFNLTPSWLLWEAPSHAGNNAWRLFIHKYPPLAIARYSFIQLSELEQCRMKNLAHGFTW